MRKGIVIAGAMIVLLLLMLLISSATVGKGWLLQKEEVDEESGEPVEEDYVFPVWYRIGFVVLLTVAFGITFLFLRVQETRKRV